MDAPRLDMLRRICERIGELREDEPTDPLAPGLMPVAALLPDDMPAGFAFIDDSTMRRAMAITLDDELGVPLGGGVLERR